MNSVRRGECSDTPVGTVTVAFSPPTSVTDTGSSDGFRERLVKFIGLGVRSRPERRCLSMTDTVLFHECFPHVPIVRWTVTGFHDFRIAE